MPNRGNSQFIIHHFRNRFCKFRKPVFWHWTVGQRVKPTHFNDNVILTHCIDQNWKNYEEKFLFSSLIIIISNNNKKCIPVKFLGPFYHYFSIKMLSSWLYFYLHSICNVLHDVEVGHKKDRYRLHYLEQKVPLRKEIAYGVVAWRASQQKKILNHFRVET